MMTMVKRILVLVLIAIFYRVGFGQTSSPVIDDRDTVVLNLAFECCTCRNDTIKVGNYQQYSLCDDGYQQPFQFFPTFVQLDLNDLHHSYDRPIFIFDMPLEEGLDYDTVSIIVDSIERMISSINLVSFYERRLHREINKRMRKVNKGLANFDGKFYYALFRVRLVRKNSLYDIRKVLPFLPPDKKSGYTHSVKAYAILDVLLTV